MQRLKRICAGTLATLIACLLTPIAALAANDCDHCDGEHIAYLADHPVSLTIHLYEKDDGNGSMPGTGEEISSPSWVGIPNVEFTITQTLDADGNTPAVPYTYTGRTDGNGLLVVPPADSSVTMPHGTYTVTETMPANADPDYEYANFTVQLPMTNPTTRSEWLYDVHAYPKNQMADETIEVTKILASENRTVQNGDEVAWQIQSTIPAGISEAQYYVVTDPLVNVLNFVSIDTVSYYNGTTDVPLTNPADYTVQYINNFDPANPNADGTATNAPGGTMVIRLTTAGMAKLAEAEAVTAEGSPLLTVDITTKVQLGDNASERIYNTANVYYKNSQGGEEEGGPDEEEKPDIVSSTIQINKINSSSQPLGGAEFVLRRAKIDGSGYEYYYYDAVTGTTQWIDEDAVDTGYTNVTVKTTGSSNGIAQFVGLADGSYQLVEVAAPQTADGRQYNLLKDAVNVTVASEGKTEDGASTFIYINEIENNLGFELPSTGGNGTLLFTLLGLGLMAAAAVAFVAYKRKKSQ